MTVSNVEERRVRRRPIAAIAAGALDGELLFKCKMLDVSEAGARLRLPTEAEGPDRFQLIDIQAGVTYSARVVWRRGPVVGLAFLHTRSVDDPATPEWLVTLWRELLADPEVVSFARSKTAA